MGSVKKPGSPDFHLRGDGREIFHGAASASGVETLASAVDHPCAKTETQNVPLLYSYKAGDCQAEC